MDDRYSSVTGVHRGRLKALAYHRANALAWSVALAAGAAALTWGTRAPPGAGRRGVGRGGALRRLLGGEAAAPRGRSRGPSSASTRRSCRRSRRPSRRRSTPAASGGTRTCSRASPTGRSCSPIPAPKLTAEEQAFVDGPVEELCGMLDEWDITHERMDLPPEAWKFIREKGFLGIIIPKSYGGLGFSAFAHSEIVTKISTRSGTAAVTVMVPNSLGPGGAADPLRDRGAEEPLPAAPRQGPRDPVLRAHQPRRRLGRRRDPRLRHRLQGHARGPGGPRHPPHLGEALHHARAGGDAPRPRLQALRSRQAPRRRGGDRHHARPRSPPRTRA